MNCGIIIVGNTVYIGTVPFQSASLNRADFLINSGIEKLTHCYNISVLDLFCKKSSHLSLI